MKFSVCALAAASISVAYADKGGKKNIVYIMAGTYTYGRRNGLGLRAIIV